MSGKRLHESGDKPTRIRGKRLQEFPRLPLSFHRPPLSFGGAASLYTRYILRMLDRPALRRVIVAVPVLPEIAPITGPMYQLFVFFMVTDPRTIVRGRRKQIVVAVLIAVMEMLIRFASDTGWPLPTAFNAAPAFLALAIVGPIAN